MAFSKTVVEDRIEVLELGGLQVRTKTTVLEDSVVLSHSFSRKIVVPRTKASGSWADTDISGESARVQAIAGVVWTNSCKTAYENLIDG